MLDKKDKNIESSLSKLKYMDIIFVYLFINKDNLSNDHWIYFPDEDIIFNRAVEFSNWSPQMCPENKTAVCFDITAYKGETIWQKCKRLTLDDKDHILLKGIHRVGPRGFVDLVDLELTKDGVERRCASATFLGLEAADLMGTVRTAGATKIDAYGSYGEEPYNREESPDMILVCRRS